MLFESAGQGLIFLLLLCLGAGCAVVDFGVKKISQIIIQKCAKIDINRQNITQNDGNLQKLQKLQNVTKLRKNIQNSTKIDKKIKKKSTKNNKKIQNITKKVIYGVAGFCEACVFATLLIGVIYWVDYGDFRFYHVLGFVVGFWLIWAIFAHMHHLHQKRANI